MTPRNARAAALLLASVALEGPAHAAGSAADALFEEGLKLFDAGRTHEACERFEASFRLDPALGTLQNLATCHEQDGRTATALAEFDQLAVKAGQSKQASREALGQKRAAALAKKLSKIALRFGADADVATIQIDGAPLDRAAWSTPFPLDPGSHTVTFAAPGKVTATRTLDVSFSPGIALFGVPRLVDAAPASTALGGSSSLRTAGLVVGGAGLVGLALGGVFGGLTFAKKSEAASHCMGKYCDDQGLSLESAAHGYAAASTALFVVGLGAVGAGTFMVVWAGREPRTAIRVAPELSASSMALHVDGAW